jgi:aldehyde:ferredoxin oxidoreductase
LIEDERAELCDASSLWGSRDTYETTDELRSTYPGCGERGHNLLKLINVRQGFSREHDQPPSLWLQPKVTPDGEIRLMDYYGRRELVAQDLERELEEYYEERGWNPVDTRPTRKKVEELGLSEVGEKWQTLNPRREMSTRRGH